MYCTYTEAARCLGFKSRDSLYQLEQKGILETYLSKINVQKQLYYMEIRGEILFQYIDHK